MSNIILRLRLVACGLARSPDQGNKTPGPLCLEKRPTDVTRIASPGTIIYMGLYLTITSKNA